MSLLKKRLGLTCFLAITNAMCIGGAQASEQILSGDVDLKNFILDEYVVTASRTEERLFDANANVSVITKDDIERMHFDSVGKALSVVPGVQFQNYSGSQGLNANYQGFDIRINGSKQVLILVDGVRMTPVGTGGTSINTNFINNMNNIERIEVLKGSAGVLYGSDAAGGVINIITKKGTENKTTLKVSGGNFGKERYDFSNSGSEDGFSWNVYYNKDIQGNFKDGNGTEWENKWNAHGGGLQLSNKFGDKHTVSVKYDENKADYFSLNPYTYFENLNKYEEQIGEIEIQETMLTHDWQFDDNTSNKIIYRTGRYNTTNRPTLEEFENRDMTEEEEAHYLELIFSGKYDEADAFYDSLKTYFEIWGGIRGNNYKTRTISDQFTKKFDERHTLIAGFDFNKTSLGMWGHENDNIYAPATIKNLGDIKNNSYYIQEKWSFDDKWNMTGGLRYDKAKANLEGKEGDMDSNLSKSLNVAYNFDDKHNIYVNYDEYFIIPTASQLTDPVYGNIDLKPAKGKNYGIGYNQIIDDKTQLSVHAFIRKADTEIGMDAVGNYENYSNSKDRGFDIQLNKRFDDRWSSFIGYSFLKHNSDTDAEIDRVKLGTLPRHAINLGVNYDYDKWNVGLTARGFLSRDDSESTVNYDVSEGGWPTDHYWTVNLGVNYQATKNVKLFAVGNNLLDTYYAESAIYKYGDHKVHPGAAYAMPGRSFVLGAEVSF